MEKAEKMPNVLIFMTDQHRYECLGCHNHPLVKTPNIDKLASEGIDFQRTYSQSAICMPSRISLFTGQYIHTHGVMHNSKHADVSGLTTLPKILKDHSYQTALIGKNHAGHCNDMGFDYSRLCAGESKGEKNDYFDYLKKNNIDKNEWRNNKTMKEYDACVLNIPNKHIVETWTGDETIKYLETLDTNKPFMLWCSFERPHAPTSVPKDNPFPYNPCDIELPLHDEKWYNKPDVRRPGCENKWNVFQSGEEKLRQAIANYYSLVSMIDAQVGRIIKHLESADKLEDTIIIFTADHGEFCGEYGQFGKNLSTFDVLYHIPFIFYWKGKTDREQVHELTEMIDIMPTVLELCGIECPRTVQGRSLADAVLGSGLRCGRPWDANDAVFFETPFVKTVRTKNYKLSICWKENISWGQLYDLNEDHKELKNLYDDPVYAHIQQKLELRILQWFIKSQQPQINGCGIDEPAPPWRWYEREKMKKSV